MEWLSEIFIEQSHIQAILILSIICAAGLALGKLKIGGVSLGISFVFFAGILAGHFGLKINSDMLLLAQNFGLIIFIYSLGIQVGPGFFSSFKKGGIKLNALSLALAVAGTALTVGLHWISGIPMPEMMGLFSGAATNTPMLGAAQQAFLQMYPDNLESANNMAIACAVGYPFGLIGVIICVIILKKTTWTPGKGKAYDPAGDNTFVTEYLISNPEIIGRTIQ
jgi:AspT/YidE/YbjL antiporter-like protein